jgi:hypothetical protein
MQHAAPPLGMPKTVNTERIDTDDALQVGVGLLEYL